MSADLDLLRETAHEAGRLALRLQEAGLKVEWKSDGTPVTDADLALDELIKRRLRAARPELGWLSEETADEAARLEARRLFMVDPIDGTAAYLKGRPWWSVSLAIVEEGRPLAGVVYAPGLEETYEAALGEGARLNGAPIAASVCQDLESCNMLSPAAAFTSWEWPEPWPQMKVENRSSVALRLALVAAGAFDAAVALTPKQDWDVAAGMLIAEEAGAVVTDHTGAALILNRPTARHPSLVAAGPALHPLILRRTAPIELPEEPAT